MSATRPDEAEAWLTRARSDLALAAAALEVDDVLAEDASFHAQQCAEKALKALLVARRVRFPRTHSIELLLDLAAAFVSPPPEIEESVVLTQYAVEARYPGAWEPVTRDEARRAIEQAARVLGWVEAELQE